LTVFSKIGFHGETVVDNWMYWILTMICLNFGEFECQLVWKDKIEKAGIILMPAF
jgi:hypothetical protein